MDAAVRGLLKALTALQNSGTGLDEIQEMFQKITSRGKISDKAIMNAVADLLKDVPHHTSASSNYQLFTYNIRNGRIEDLYQELPLDMSDSKLVTPTIDAACMLYEYQLQLEIDHAQDEVQVLKCDLEEAKTARVGSNLPSPSPAVVAKQRQKKAEEHKRQQRHEEQERRRQQRARRQEEDSEVVDPQIRAMRAQRQLEQELRLQEHEAQCGIAVVGRCARRQCERFSRRVPDNQPWTRVMCSEKCEFIYHFPGCWRAVTRRYSDEDLKYGAPCMTPDCDGFMVEVVTRTGDPKAPEHWLVQPPVPVPVAEPSLDSNVVASIVSSASEPSTFSSSSSDPHSSVAVPRSSSVAAASSSVSAASSSITTDEVKKPAGGDDERPKLSLRQQKKLKRQKAKAAARAAIAAQAEANVVKSKPKPKEVPMTQEMREAKQQPELIAKMLHKPAVLLKKEEAVAPPPAPKKKEKVKKKKYVLNLHEFHAVIPEAHPEGQDGVEGMPARGFFSDIDELQADEDYEVVRQASIRHDHERKAMQQAKTDAEELDLAEIMRRELADHQQRLESSSS